MPQPDLLRGARRIACLGDSITEQGDAPGGYVSILREEANRLYPEPGIEVIGAGVGGNRSNDMRSRFQGDILRRRPDFFTLSCGINDVWSGFDPFHPDGGGPRAVSLSAYRRNIQAMVEAAQAERVLAVVLSTTVLEEDANSKGNLLLKDYNAILKHIADLTGSPHIDLYTPFLEEIARHRAETGDRKLWLTVDGVHLNGRGNALMARLILAGISG
ncbi:MAG TPA: GDSL-type esterase/lipase family protein [Armatimonadota bacterium]|jgi:lysophospholipase L1-like esterase